MASLFPRRLLWLLGCIPLLSADFAIAATLAQLSVPEQRLAQQDEEIVCIPDEWRNALNAADWQRLMTLLKDCDYEFLSSPRNLSSDLKQVVRRGHEQQQIVALYGLQELGLQALERDDSALTTLTADLIDWLTQELASDGTALTATGEAIAAQVLSSLAVNVMATLDPAENLTGAEAFLDGYSAQPFNLPASVGALEQLARRSDPRLQIAAAEALRDIGYGWQTKLDALWFANQMNVGDDRRTWADAVVNTMIEQLGNSLAAKPPITDEDSEASQSPLSLAAEVAQVEALGAFLYLIRPAEDSDNLAIAGLPDTLLPSESPCLLRNAVGSGEGTEAKKNDNDRDTEPPPQQIDLGGIQVLNCLSAQPRWELEDDKTVAFDTLVRAAAIAELERLGALPTFRGPLAQQLRDLALSQEYPERAAEQPGGVTAARNSATDNIHSRSEADLSHTNDWTNIATDIRIGGVESMGRVEALPDPQRPRGRTEQERRTQASAEAAVGSTREYRDLISDDLNLLVLLADGLENADLDEQTAANEDLDSQELQQRAEIAFEELYVQDPGDQEFNPLNQDFHRLHRAVRYASASGNPAIQRNAVKALGAFSYRRLSAPLTEEQLEAIAEALGSPPDNALESVTQFLGFSLLCSPEVEVRRDAAFALAQLASYHPHLLKAPLGDTWGRLAPVADPKVESGLTESFDKRCRAFALGDQETEASDHGDVNKPSAKDTKVIDALVLRLGDREEQVIVMAALALSRYGLALTNDINENDTNLRSRGRRTPDPDEADQITRMPQEIAQAEQDLDRIKACMHVLISPTRFEKWPEEMNDDPMYAPLAAATERYTEICKSADAYELPENNYNKQAIAAAFVLGQVGISDGDPEASDAERTSVAFLLRSLRGRDLLAQEEQETTIPEWITSVDTLQMAHPYRQDSVRDGIVSYALSQIHPREHDLVQQLIAAVTFPDEERRFNLPEEYTQLPQFYVGRALSCADPTRTETPEEMPVCIDDPVTRAAVVGAIEVIGLEALRAIDAADLRRQERHQAQREYVQAYLTAVRQLLVQDVSPVLTEAVTTTVVERIMRLAGSANEDAETLLAEGIPDQLIDAAGPGNGDDSSEYSPLPEPAGDTSSPKAEDSPVANRNGILSPRAEEILSMHGNLAATRYALAMPFTSLYSCAGAAYGLAQLGVYNDKTVDHLINYLFVYPQPLIDPANSETGDYNGNFCMPDLLTAGSDRDDDDLPSRLEQLEILKTGAIAALGGIELHEPEAVRVHPRDEIELATTNPEDLNLSDSHVGDDTVVKVVACLVNVANLKPLVLSDESCSPETAVAQSNEVDGWDELSLSDVFVTQAQELELTPNDIKEGRTEGLLPIETIQAAKWGLTPEEFFSLKLRLQEPAIAAIGQLALTDDGEAAIDALAIVIRKKQPDDTVVEEDPPITGGSRGIQGLSEEALRTLKLDNLEAVLLGLQESPNIPGRDPKIDGILSNYLLPELTLDRTDYRVRDKIDQYFPASTEAGLGEYDQAAIDALTDGLRQEVQRLVENYRREFSDIPEDLAERLPDISTAQYEKEKADLEDELTKEYSQRLLERAEEIWEYDRAFRDDVLQVLVSLESSTIQGLSYATRAGIITALGVEQRPVALAQECLSEEDVFDRERLCHGVAKLVSAALAGDVGVIARPDARNNVEFLEALAGSEETSFDVETTPVIQASAIEYLGDLNGLEVGITASSGFHTLLLARLAADEEPGVTETAIAAYLNTASPDSGVTDLIRTLNDPDSSQHIAAAQTVARLGQAAYQDPADLPSGEDYTHWQVPLRNPQLIAALVNAADNPNADEELQRQAISAIGHTRTDDESAIALLQSTLNNPDKPLEQRLAAAYALGNIVAEHGAIADSLGTGLLALVLGEETPSELQVVSAFALSKFDDVGEGINALPRSQRMEYATNLIHLYRDAQAAPSSGDDLLISPNTQKAIILYALGQIDVDPGIATRPAEATPTAVAQLIEAISEIYAEALSNPDNPIAVRVTAATYARNLPLWETKLVNAIADAFDDPNLAVRYAAIESTRLRPANSLEPPTRFQDLTESLENEEQLFEALLEVFWNEREYAFVRLRAGLALDDELIYPSEAEGEPDLYAPENELFARAIPTALTEDNEDDFDQEFADALTALLALDETSIDFRAEGSDAILQALRSAELLGTLDELNQQLLFEILEAIRPGGLSLVDGIRRFIDNVLK